MIEINEYCIITFVKSKMIIFLKKTIKTKHFLDSE